jgi:hypothetical protein
VVVGSFSGIHLLEYGQNILLVVVRSYGGEGALHLILGILAVAFPYLHCFFVVLEIHLAVGGLGYQGDRLETHLLGPSMKILLNSSFRLLANTPSPDCDLLPKLLSLLLL